MTSLRRPRLLRMTLKTMPAVSHSEPSVLVDAHCTVHAHHPMFSDHVRVNLWVLEVAFGGGRPVLAIGGCGRRLELTAGSMSQPRPMVLERVNAGPSPAGSFTGSRDEHRVSFAPPTSAEPASAGGTRSPSPSSGKLPSRAPPRAPAYATPTIVTPSPQRGPRASRAVAHERTGEAHVHARGRVGVCRPPRC